MRNPPFKILILLPIADGGVFDYVCEIIKYLPKHIYELHIVSKGGRLKRLEELGVHLHFLDITLPVPIAYISIRALRKLVREVNPDLVHLHTLRAGVIGVSSLARSVVPIVYTGHSWRYRQKRDFMSRRFVLSLEKYVCRRAAFVTFLGTNDFKLGKEKKLLSESKARIIPTQINMRESVGCGEVEQLKKALGFSAGSLVIGTVGRLTYAKDPEAFFRIGSKLAGENENIGLLWVGDGEMRSHVNKIIKSKRLERRVVITGFIPKNKISEYLSVIDIFLLTSRFEGLPLSLLEAMFLRKPVVASSVGNIPELIISGLSGWNYVPGDENAAINILKEIINDKAGVVKIVNRAYDIVREKHSNPEKMALSFSDLYQTTIRQNDSH